jgi:large subunit ribosomal protein LP1
MVLSNDELACVYAALILADDHVDIKGDKIATILKTVNYEIEPYWPGLFASALEDVNITDLIKNVGSSSVSATVPLNTTADNDKQIMANKDVKKNDEKKMVKDDSDEGEDMVRTLVSIDS